MTTFTGTTNGVPWTLHQGDCLAVLKTLPDNSVDSIVTDPPAGIAFMGKGWDGDKGGRHQWVGWMESVARECLRVVKPGGHALVWGLPRTSHWTGWAWENADWEVRDKIVHLNGQGFPKSLSVSKAIDNQAGADREVLGPSKYAAKANKHPRAMSPGDLPRSVADTSVETAPATDKARQWEGWGTALKPSAEDWWLFRKPLEGTVAANVLAHGTGAMNIDGCRISTGTDEPDSGAMYYRNRGLPMPVNRQNYFNGPDQTVTSDPIPGGRWPANVALSHNEDCRQVGTRKVPTATTYEPDAGRPMQKAVYGKMTTLGRTTWYGNADGTETVPQWDCVEDCPVRMLDEQGGEHPGCQTSSDAVGSESILRPGQGGYQRQGPIYPDTGVASRFFYVAKPSRRERGEGNDHPTIKSVSLMRWLCRLITPPGGTVLDPFAGSGTTGLACVAEGFTPILIEQDPHYTGIIKSRLATLTPAWLRDIETDGDTQTPTAEEAPASLEDLLGLGEK